MCLESAGKPITLGKGLQVKYLTEGRSAKSFISLEKGELQVKSFRFSAEFLAGSCAPRSHGSPPHKLDMEHGGEPKNNKQTTKNSCLPAQLQVDLELLHLLLVLSLSFGQMAMGFSKSKSFGPQ